MQYLNLYKVEPAHAERMDFLDIYKKNLGSYDVPPVMPQLFDENIIDKKWAPENKSNSGKNSKFPRRKKNIQSKEYCLRRINATLKEIHNEKIQSQSGDFFMPKRGVSETSRQYIKESAIRSLYDWRLSLQYLARLRVRDGLLVLSSSADQYVIDSFNIFLTKDRKPNLAHQMISFLMRPLKMRTIISTNFDTLIEDAFKDINVPLQVISVEKRSRLPNPNSVVLGKTLIKIHGSLNETRADYSLDDVPTTEDKEAFLQYIWPLEDGLPRFVPSSLLVMGTMIPDKRTVSLIKYVCDVTSANEFRVYVIAYNKATICEIYEAFGKEYINGDNSNRFTFTLTSKLDLLLFELYQTKTFSLPPAGFNYEVSQYIPPVNPAKYLELEDNGDGAGDRKFRVADNGNTEEVATSNISSWVKKSLDKNGNKIIIIDGEYSVTHFSAAMFYALRDDHGKDCLWFELEDFDNPVSILSEIFNLVSMMTGKKNIEAINVEFQYHSEIGEKIFIDEIRTKMGILCAHYGIDRKEWCLFFYGRNIPGSCFGFGRDTSWRGDPWFPEAWKINSGNENYEIFWIIINILIDYGFNIFYLPRTKLRKNYYLKKGDLNKIGVDKKTLEIYNNILEKYNEIHDTTYDCIKNNAFEYRGKNIKYYDIKYYGKSSFDDQSIHRLIKFLLEDSTKLSKKVRFIHSSTLFRQSRSVSALLSEASHTSKMRFLKYISLDDDENNLRNSNKEILDWKERLHSAEIQFFNRKSGGFSWLYGEQRLLANIVLGAQVGSAGVTRSSEGVLAINHYWIGLWHLRAFYSSMHMDPLRESLYHMFMCLRAVGTAVCDYDMLDKYGCLPKCTPKGNEVSKRKIVTENHRISLLKSSLYTIAKILTVAHSFHARWSRGHEEMKDLFWENIKYELGLSSSWKGKVRGDVDISSIFISDENKLKNEKRFEIWVRNSTGIKLSENISKQDLTVLLQGISSIREGCIRLERDILRTSYFVARPDKKYRGLTLPGAAGNSFHAIVTPYFSFTPFDSWELVPLAYFPKIDGKIDSFIKNVHTMSIRHSTLLTDNKTDLESFASAIQAKRNQMAIDFSNSPYQLHACLVFLFEYVYLLLRQAKFETRRKCLRKYLQPGEKDSDSSIDDWRATRLWELVGLWSQAGLELLHSLPPTLLSQEYKLRVKFLTMSALSLGRLNKFSEAHQNLNSATGIAFNLPSNESGKEIFILKVRRVELHLLEAMFYAGTLKKDSKNAAKKIPAEIRTTFHNHLMQLDEAVSSIDEAESLKQNCSTSSIWAGKIHYARIMVYAEHFTTEFGKDRSGLVEKIRRRPRIYRDIQSARGNLLFEIEQGLLSCGDDIYRVFCFINVFIKALRKMEFFYKSIDGFSSEIDSEKFRNDSLTTTFYSLGGISNDTTKLSDHTESSKASSVKKEDFVTLLNGLSEKLKYRDNREDAPSENMKKEPGGAFSFAQDVCSVAFSALGLKPINKLAPLSKN